MPAIDLDAIALAVRTVVSAITAIPIARVYWSRQDHPESARPYAVLRHAIPGVAGVPEERKILQKQLHTVQVDDDADGAYTITIDGDPHSYGASGDTATQIRDELVDAVNAGTKATAMADPDPGPGGQPRLLVEGLVVGELLEVTQTANLSQITVGPYSLPTRDVLRIERFAVEELIVTVQISTVYDEAAPSLNTSAPSLIEDLRKSVFLPSHHDVLAAARCPVLRVGGLLDFGDLRGAQWEHRAAVELVLAVPSGVGEEPGTIETMGVTGTII